MLTDITCRAASCPPDKKRARFADSGGLYLEVSPSGSKRWFWKYYFADKERRLAIGSYPAVPLKQARSDRDDARKVLASGSDPAKRRQIERLEAKMHAINTFEAVARELHTPPRPAAGVPRTPPAGWSAWKRTCSPGWGLFPYQRSRRPCC